MKPIKDWATYMAREIDASDSGGLEILPILERFVKRIRNEDLEEVAKEVECYDPEGALLAGHGAKIANKIRALKEPEQSFRDRTDSKEEKMVRDANDYCEKCKKHVRLPHHCDGQKYVRPIHKFRLDEGPGGLNEAEMYETRIRQIVREEIQKIEEEKRQRESHRCRCGPGGMPLDGCQRHPWEPVMKPLENKTPTDPMTDLECEIDRCIQFGTLGECLTLSDKLHHFDELGADYPDRIERKWLDLTAHIERIREGRGQNHD